MGQTPGTVQLKRQTVAKFDAYVREAEAEMDATLAGKGSFLWSDSSPEVVRQVRRGEVVAQRWSGNDPVKVPDGLIHDWIGALLVGGATIKDTLALIQDYDHHQNVYRPEVIASKLIKQRGNDYQIYLRLLKKKILTVVLDTDHAVHYHCLDRNRWECRSHTTRIAEVEDAGTAKERVRTPDTGYGFLWRLNSYWRFQQNDDGVRMECRAISLSRDVPFGLGWIIEPIIQKLPKESLINTLESTRQALRHGVLK